MLSFPRPPEPPDFARRIAKAQAAITAMHARGECPKSDHFENRWRELRAIFVKAQFGKCAYCERDVTPTSYGDVEHVRPKAGVQELTADRTRWGEEAEGGNVVGRTPRDVSSWGYHWLAYAWTNYVLACDKCNRSWKKNLFPLAEGPRLLPPSSARKETPLLLNPFEGPDPVKHLAFDERGQISARDDSRRGEATIRTCGLHRERLRNRREDVAKRLYRMLRSLEDASSDEETDELLDQVEQLGAPDKEHAGMVRSIFEVYFRADWGEYFGDGPPGGEPTAR